MKSWVRHCMDCLRGARGTWILSGYYAHPIGDPDHWFFDDLKISADNDNGD